MHEREESEKRVTGLWAVAVAVDNIKDAWQKKEKPTASHQSLHAQMHQIKMASTNHVHPRNSLSDFLSLSQTFISLEWYTDHSAPIAQMHARGPSPQVQMNLWEFNTNTWDFTDLQQLTTYPADARIGLELLIHRY